jgi:rod shape-determining protein MreC
VGAVGLLQDALGFIPNYFDLRDENRILRSQNVTLADETSRLREASLENIRLRKLLELKERTPYSYVAANVVGKTLQLMRNTITLDVGEKDGVQFNMPIITDAGLVGRVISTSSAYSVGQILFNKDFRASGKVQRGRVDGIVSWEGGDKLSLNNVAKTLDVQPGDVVMTSEYSSIFPAGIKIGVVSATKQSPGGLFQSVERLLHRWIFRGWNRPLLSHTYRTRAALLPSSTFPGKYRTL